MRLDACNVIFVHCFAKQELRREHCQKPKAETFGRNPKIAAEHIVGQIHQFVEL